MQRWRRRSFMLLWCVCLGFTGAAAALACLHHPTVPAMAHPHPVPCLEAGTAVIAVAFGLAGCAAGVKLSADPPGLGVPWISGLEIIPSRITLGCPASIQFRFEDSDGDPLRSVAHWEIYRSKSFDSARGYITLPVQPEMWAGRTRGEVSAHSTPERFGRYRYHVQVEDTGGRKSNVLQGSLLVEPPLP